ncbi:hypothetical protein H9P43_001618 [Blastocladiella emersonii ATCC 22665]|nr:hypothetical protein H9P43_001618 [Blastocladiella emersonii ATCC 22665]
MVSTVTSPFRIPVCSFISASYDLSDKKQYPYFFRYRTTTPSDARGMISFMKKYGWSRFSIVQEGGYPVYQLLTEFLQRYAAAERMTVLGTTVLQASAANLEDTMATLREQLLAADARVICIGHLSSVAAKLLVHLYRHGFMATPPGMPRVFLFLNDPTYDLQILAPDLYPAILESAAIFSLAPQTLDNNRILPDFLAYYAARNGGMSYPYPSALGFEEGYACGFSMVYGLDQLVRTTPGATYADLAARSPALYARMNVSLFSVTEAAYPQFPLPLDASGDAIARYYYLRTPVVVPGTSVTNASYVVQRVDSIPPNPNVVLAAYAFPGMALGEVPPDASQKAMLNIHWLSASGIAITATVSLLAAGVLASFVVCIVFRERRPIWRSSLVSLVVVHVSTLLTLAYVLSMLGVPVPATCTARSVLSVWSPAILLACAASRLYPLDEKLFLSNALRRKVEVLATALEKPHSRASVETTGRILGMVALMYLVPTVGSILLFSAMAALIQLVLIALCLRWAWGARESGFNISEAKRWGVALLNAVGVLIMATGISISADTAGRFYTFYNLLLALGSASTLGILVGPIHLRVFSRDPREQAAASASATSPIVTKSLHTESDPDLCDLGSAPATASMHRAATDAAVALGQHHVASTGGAPGQAPAKPERKKPSRNAPGRSPSPAKRTRGISDNRKPDTQPSRRSSKIIASVKSMTGPDESAAELERQMGWIRLHAQAPGTDGVSLAE